RSIDSRLFQKESEDGTISRSASGPSPRSTSTGYPFLPHGATTRDAGTSDQAERPSTPPMHARPPHTPPPTPNMPMSSPTPNTASATPSVPPSTSPTPAATTATTSHTTPTASVRCAVPPVLLDRPTRRGVVQRHR